MCAGSGIRESRRAEVTAGPRAEGSSTPRSCMSTYYVVAYMCTYGIMHACVYVCMYMYMYISKRVFVHASVDTDARADRTAAIDVISYMRLKSVDSGYLSKQ